MWDINSTEALATWLGWLEGCTIHQKVVGLIPNQDTIYIGGLIPGRGTYRRQPTHVILT